MKVCKDNNGYIRFIFHRTGEASANIYSVDAWDSDEMKLPCRVSFFAGAWVKSDFCSHFYFNGEDHPEDGDSYYHVCGSFSYRLFFIGMLFANLCYMADRDPAHIDKEEYEDIKGMWDSLSCEYKIEEMDDNFFKHLCLENQNKVGG